VQQRGSTHRARPNARRCNKPWTRFHPPTQPVDRVQTPGTIILSGTRRFRIRTWRRYDQGRAVKSQDHRFVGFAVLFRLEQNGNTYFVCILRYYYTDGMLGNKRHAVFPPYTGTFSRIRRRESDIAGPPCWEDEDDGENDIIARPGAGRKTQG
jgi:hypothetical protein